MIAPKTISIRQRKSELGQFLTSPAVAQFMASLFGPVPRNVRLLDAGAGAGELTAAFVSQLGGQGVATVEATLYEIDPAIIKHLSARMIECQRKCALKGIKFSFQINESDFIREMANVLGDELFSAPPPLFDVAIVNPPYRKISGDSSERHALRSIGIETSNLYTGFIAIIQRLLAPSGQIVAITPRSFCNGTYFKNFREEFLSEFSMRRLHIFESREAAFSEEKVLQENIIFHAVKSRERAKNLVISSSSGEEGSEISEALLPFSEIVHPDDTEKFIHIPSTGSHAEAKRALGNLSTTLDSLGISVSTGRIVEFRMRNLLRMVPEEMTVPLIYPCHFKEGEIQWPRLDSRKPNAIVDNDESGPWLVPSGIYLLAKRFTSKEERRRLVACLFDPTKTKAKRLGFENHLNYFHAHGRGLDRKLAKGLFAFLNSTVVDQYFRRFSGHTQVNAGDLRKLRYPSREVLLEIGRSLKTLKAGQEAVDLLVNKHLYASQKSNQ